MTDADRTAFPDPAPPSRDGLCLGAGFDRGADEED